MDFDSNILFIPNVKLDDIKSSLKPSTLKETITKFNIPNSYTREIWPQITNVRCRYCTLEHKNKPVFIPPYIEENRIPVSNKLFCSFPCATAYILNKEGENSTLLQNLATLYYIYTGIVINTSQLRPSPDPFLMNIYCGDNAGEYSEESYADMVNSLMNMDYI
jgi:hypothetical protein